MLEESGRNALSRSRGGKPWSVVGDANLHEISVDYLGLDHDGAAHAAALADRLDRVAQKIDQHLLDLQEVDHDGRKIGGDGQPDGHMKTIEIGLA